MKKYSSFEELDRDINIYNLQRQIDREELKISLHQTKQAVTPSKLVTGAIEAVATSSIIIKLLSPLLPFIIGKLIGNKK